MYIYVYMYIYKYIYIYYTYIYIKGLPSFDMIASELRLLFNLSDFALFQQYFLILVPKLNAIYYVSTGPMFVHF